MFDRLFDGLNVNRFTRRKHKRKVFQDPYRSQMIFYSERDKSIAIILLHNIFNLVAER